MVRPPTPESNIPIVCLKKNPIQLSLNRVQIYSPAAGGGGAVAEIPNFF
jgi:hypothetical protein